VSLAYQLHASPDWCKQQVPWALADIISSKAEDRRKWSEVTPTPSMFLARTQDVSSQVRNDSVFSMLPTAQSPSSCQEFACDWRWKKCNDRRTGIT